MTVGYGAEVNLNIDTEEIVAIPVLRYQWTREAEEDLRNFHDLDAAAEMTRIIAEEINAEIDIEIMADLRNATMEPIRSTPHDSPLPTWYEQMIATSNAIYARTKRRHEESGRVNWKKEGF